MNTPHTKRGRVRVIGGSLRRRVLEVPEHQGLRPTGDRVRETLFNWLQFTLAGRRVLDAFAGSGILGIEALSRGAESAVFIDNNKNVCQHLEEQLKTFKLAHAWVRCADSYHLPPFAQAFDLIFIDPPFADGRLQESLQQFCRPAWLRPNGLIYIESQQPLNTLHIPEPFVCVKEKKAGAVFFGLLSSSL